MILGGGSFLKCTFIYNQYMKLYLRMVYFQNQSLFTLWGRGALAIRCVCFELFCTPTVINVRQIISWPHSVCFVAFILVSLMGIAPFKVDAPLPCQ
jgi:hypothetical protein